MTTVYVLMRRLTVAFLHKNICQWKGCVYAHSRRFSRLYSPTVNLAEQKAWLKRQSKAELEAPPCIPKAPPKPYLRATSEPKNRPLSETVRSPRGSPVVEVQASRWSSGAHRPGFQSPSSFRSFRLTVSVSRRPVLGAFGRLPATVCREA